MKTAITRRRFSLIAGAAAAGASASCPIPVFAESGGDALVRMLAAVEKRLGARLGATIHDTATGRFWQQRADERFPMASTFKLLACAAVLSRVDKGREDLSRRIRFSAADVVTYSPATKDRAGGAGMTLAEICAAAMTLSDNTAGNLILKSLGGPKAVTGFARTLGDTETRLDRWETALNEGTPGDPRDTTTPAAMAANLRKLVLGDILSPRSRAQLISWMVANKTGDAKLRAGLPGNWRIGDKTGGGGHGSMADVAVIWAPGRRAVIASIYMSETKASFNDRNAGIAAIGRSLRDVL